MAKNVRTGKRGKLFYFFVGTSLVLTVVCACLVVAIFLLNSHFSSICETSVGDTHHASPTAHSKQINNSNSEMAAETKPWQLQYRLPPDTQPVHYDILLHPDLENFTFSGEVIIQIDVKAARSFLVVHTKNLDIHETRLTNVLGAESDGTKKRKVGEEKVVEIGEAFEYKPNEFWVVQLRGNQELTPGIYNLHLKFKGSLTGKIVGFYRSIYTDSRTNEKRKIATSKFQPTYARQAYPCFDEPGFKPTYKVRLVRPRDDYTALSNMDQVDEKENTPETGLTTVEFRESVPMVTYLSCFIVSDFQRLNPIQISQGFPFSVYSAPGQVQKTKYALELGAKITEFYIQYFGIPYPLPKLDMIAIPDFVSGAMEHWGLITFREANLLFEEGVSSTGNKQRVATVIGHELAHMWFGNLMTVKWWDDLWLNEGFASYIEYKGVDHAHPDWQMLEQFLIEDLHGVLTLDSSVTSHPIVQSVGHPDEITELFDTISYSKGASVIRMLEDFMGEEEFRKGITNFLNRFKFANAVTQDLWDELQKVREDLNITSVMDSWTRQMGYPVVMATQQPNGVVSLTQQRFLSDPDANTTDDSPYGYKWEVPITFISSESNTIKREWLPSDKPSVTINIPQNASWFKINWHQKGFYRVNYDEENWKALSNVLSNNLNVLDVSDRAHLLDDVFNLADGGQVSYNLAMDMTKYLVSETEYIPWKVASSKISKLDTLLVSSPSYSKLRKYVQSLVADAYRKVTLSVSESDSHLKRLLRPTIVSLACYMGVQECIDEVVAIFKLWSANGGTVPKPHPDIRSAVYSYGIKVAGGEKEWDLMWNLYLQETDAQERTKLLSGLAHSTEPWILQRYLQYSKNESNVRSQDFFTVLTYISNNPVGNSIIWNFVRDEWEYLVNRFTLNDRYLGRIIPSITAGFQTELKLKEMETFFAKYPEAGAGKDARKQALDKVQKNIKWLTLHKKTLEDWLDSAVPI